MCPLSLLVVALFFFLPPSQLAVSVGQRRSTLQWGQQGAGSSARILWLRLERGETLLTGPAKNSLGSGLPHRCSVGVPFGRPPPPQAPPRRRGRTARDQTFSERLGISETLQDIPSAFVQRRPPYSRDRSYPSGPDVDSGYIVTFLCAEASPAWLQLVHRTPLFTLPIRQPLCASALAYHKTKQKATQQGDLSLHPVPSLACLDGKVSSLSQPPLPHTIRIVTF